MGVCSDVCMFLCDGNIYIAKILFFFSTGESDCSLCKITNYTQYSYLCIFFLF